MSGCWVSGRQTFLSRAGDPNSSICALMMHRDFLDEHISHQSSITPQTHTAPTLGWSMGRRGRDRVLGSLGMAQRADFAHSWRFHHIP